MTYYPSMRFAQTKQTTDATVTTIAKVPVAEGTTVHVEIVFQTASSTLANGASGDASAVFRRAAGGNVARATGNAGLLDAALRMIGDFVLMPKVEIVANTTDQTADVRFTGLATTTLNWEYTINVRRT